MHHIHAFKKCSSAVGHLSNITYKGPAAQYTVNVCGGVFISAM